MKITKAIVRKSNERYDVFDTDFESLIISATILKPLQTTMDISIRIKSSIL